MKDNLAKLLIIIVKIPGVVRAVLQTSLLLNQSSFSSRPSKQLCSKTLQAMDLNFFTQYCLTPICHISHVTCNMSYVMCHMSQKKLRLKGVELVSRESVINRVTV